MKTRRGGLLKESAMITILTKQPKIRAAAGLSNAHAGGDLASLPHSRGIYSYGSRLKLVLLFLGAILPAHAQTFNSGSTGADGAFAPTSSQAVQVPAGGVFNYTTVTIPANVTITYTKNARNTPVTILAAGNVTIGGTISLSGGNGSTAPNGAGSGGPGGFDGGGGGGVNAFGAVTYYGLPGDGPGGGGGGQGSPDGSGTVLGGGGGGGFSAPGFTGAHQGQNGSTASDGTGGPIYGATSLLQLIGGSGGGGGGSVGNQIAGGGGGGGGAILIASSGTIAFSSASAIYANGGIGGAINIGNLTILNGGGGAGGTVRLVATTLTGSPVINVSGGRSGIDYYIYPQLSGRGGNGFARFEAYNFSVFQPNVIGPFLSNQAPTSAMLSPPPSLLITSVGGVTPPAVPKGDFNSPPDITLPIGTASPTSVTIKAANIPVGTVVSVELTPQTGAKIFLSSTPLAGSATASSASASVTLPASMMSVLIASVTIDLTGTSMGNLPPLIINGEKVMRLQVATAFGGASQITYITESGRRITREQLLGALPRRAAKK